MPLHSIVLVEGAWICPEVCLMPTQLYFYIFSLNNCKLFITNSSCSIFAWNHKNKQHKGSPQTCFTLQRDLGLYEGRKLCEAAPCSPGGKKLLLDIPYCLQYGNCARREPLPSEKLTAPRWAVYVPITENVPTPVNMLWLPLPALLGNWMIFKASKCSDPKMLGPYSGETAIELLRTPVGS